MLFHQRGALLLGSKFEIDFDDVGDFGQSARADRH